ncbi:MAG: nitroreductase family protein [Pseudobdellovibrionaceae bacterium]
MKSFLAAKTLEQNQHWMAEQVHIALGVLLAAAASHKIDSCPLGGFSKPDYDRILNLQSRGLRSVVLCALGQRDESDKYAASPKIRFKNDRLFEFLT